ncbi:MAG: C4-dicarboxylate ABC transporter [Rhizobiaceae bacterium MnEN-MB40S]|nr:MAG: C4-dicarboxylate ABC transporter [Rhizobiaceae bacterium MnEN-MB40S]
MKTILKTGVAFLALAAASGFAHAETFSFTVVAGHPPITKGVANIRDFFIPEVNRRLEEQGEHSIEWTEAYAGSVADVKGVLEAVETGIAEFGYVPHLFEGDKLPLEQITYVTPFGTSDLPALLKVITKLHEEIPEMDAAWAKNNQKLLAPVGIDDYQFVTNFEIETPADIEGHKIGTGGLALNWLTGSGATPVAGALTTYYNSISTGLIDGAIVFESAIAPYKFYEVAPYVTKIGFGAKYSSALTINLDVWNSLPDDVKSVITDVAAEYRDKTAEAYYTAGSTSLDKASAEGAKISSLSPEMRTAYADNMPNIARNWAEKLDSQGQPGSKTLETFMQLSNEAGLEFARDWTAE